MYLRASATGNPPLLNPALPGIAMLLASMLGSGCGRAAGGAGELNNPAADYHLYPMNHHFSGHQTSCLCYFYPSLGGDCIRPVLRIIWVSNASLLGILYSLLVFIGNRGWK